MLLTAIWHILSSGKSYSAHIYLMDWPTAETQVFTMQQAHISLKSWGFIISDDPSSNTS